MDMLEYIKWRGDLTVDERELNEIDSLIFSTLCYEEFDDILSDGDSYTLDELAEIFFAMYEIEDLKKRINFSSRSYELLKAMKYTKRYGSLIVSHYVNEINHELDLQFCALTIENKEKWRYIAYRGTDDTIVGWKEDFSMIYRKEVLAQRKAVEYLEMRTKETGIQKLFSKYRYYVGGHSKGGNLAMYAGANASADIQKKIKRIDNFDGPGFEDGFWQQESTYYVLDKIHTYIPTASLFGRLFIHKEKVSVVESKQVGLLQHVSFNWSIDVDHFKYADSVSEGSDKAVNKVNELLKEINNEEKEELVESLFTLFDNLNIYTLNDITKINFNHVLIALKEISELNNKERKVLLEILRVVWDIADIGV